MKGKDYQNRPFIVIKSIIDGHLFMETFFIRYNLEISRWHCCGNYTHRLISDCYELDNDRVLYMKSLIEKGEVKITDIHTSIGFFHNKISRVYDEKKWNAATIIQKQFLKARYDTKYKMCERIQMRNLNDILREKI